MEHLKRKFIASKELVDRLDSYDYDEMVKLAAVLKMLEEDVITDEMIQKWGINYKGKSYLEVVLCKKKKEETDDEYVSNFQTKKVRIEISEF